MTDPVGVTADPRKVLMMGDEPEDDGRAEFETFFAESRRGRGPSKAPTFQRLQDGTYADDHTQRHWWTWQQSRKALEAA